MKHWICKELIFTLLKIHIYSIMISKKMWCIGEHLIVLKTSYKEFHSKLHSHVKVFFGIKDLKSFSKVIPLAPSYSFWPNWQCHFWVAKNILQLKVMFSSINDTREVIENIVEEWGFVLTAWSISSCSNNRGLLIGDNTLQIKQEKNVRHIAEKFERMQNIDTNGQFTHS